jgi:hypothetical protein
VLIVIVCSGEGSDGEGNATAGAASGDIVEDISSDDAVLEDDDDDDGDGDDMSSDAEYIRDIAAAINDDTSPTAIAAHLQLPPRITSRLMKQRREWRYFTVVLLCV